MNQGTNRAQRRPGNPLHRPTELLLSGRHFAVLPDMLWNLPEFDRINRLSKSDRFFLRAPEKLTSKMTQFGAGLGGVASEYVTRWRYSNKENVDAFQSDIGEKLNALRTVRQILKAEGTESFGDYGIGNPDNQNPTRLHEVFDSDTAEMMWRYKCQNAGWVLEQAEKQLIDLQKANRSYYVERQRRADPAAKIFVQEVFRLYARLIDKPTEQISISASAKPGSDAMQFMTACLDVLIERSDGESMAIETIVSYVKDK